VAGAYTVCAPGGLFSFLACLSALGSDRERKRPKSPPCCGSSQTLNAESPSAVTGCDGGGDIAALPCTLTAHDDHGTRFRGSDQDMLEEEQNGVAHTTTGHNT